MATQQAYCLKCKAHKKLTFDKDNGGTKKGTYKIVKTKGPTGRRLSGMCTCGTRVSKILPKKV